MKETIITYINRKTNISYEFKGIHEGNGKFILEDNEGKQHLFGENTVKKNYKKNVVVLEDEPKIEEKTLNRHQKLAKRQVKAAYGWTVGGFENRLNDEGIELPSVEEMFNQVYDTTMNEDCGEGFAGGVPKTELRFAGKQFILDEIAKLFRADGIEVPEELTKVTKKTKQNGPRKNLHGDINEVNENQVIMRAFTGMVIGVFDIVKKSKKFITVKTAKGNIKFDINTGMQINPEKEKFANRIDV